MNIKNNTRRNINSFTRFSISLHMKIRIAIETNILECNTQQQAWLLWNLTAMSVWFCCCSILTFVTNEWDTMEWTKWHKIKTKKYCHCGECAHARNLNIWNDIIINDSWWSPHFRFCYHEIFCFQYLWRQQLCIPYCCCCFCP